MNHFQTATPASGRARSYRSYVAGGLTMLGIGGMLGVTGCGTVVTRTGGSSLANFYPATVYDGITIGTGGGIWAAGDCANGLGPVAGWGLVVPLHVVDLPISIATDTLLLPIDAVRAGHENQAKAKVEGLDKAGA